MCDSIQPIPRHFDPWQFAKGQGEQRFELALSTTQELVKDQTEGVITAVLRGYVDVSQQYHLAGQVEVMLKALCQRCLEDMALPIKQDFDYVLIRTQEQEAQVEGSFESLICPESELDIAWFLEEEILLAIPHVSRHEYCTIPQPVSDEPVIESELASNPFAVLKTMLNQSH